MENLVNHARRMVEESDMTLDAKMEVLDFLKLDEILALQKYQELEEKGLLVKLELKVGDTVTWSDICGQPKDYIITGYSFGEAEDYIYEPVVTDEIVYYCTTSNGGITGSFAASEIGKSVFLKK